MTKFSEVFVGNQMHQVVAKVNISRTISVIIIRDQIPDDDDDDDDQDDSRWHVANFNHITYLT